MLLHQLPPELIGAITSFTNSHDLSMLYFCGDRRLNWLLSQKLGVTTFIWTEKMDSNEIPQIASVFSSLRTVIIQNAYNLLDRSLSRPRVIFAPTLERLELRFPDSGDYFLYPVFPRTGDMKPLAPDMNVAEIYPNLKFLKYHHDSLSIVPHLPDSLVELTVWSRDITRPQKAPVTLPSSLEYIYFSMPMLEPQPSDYKWPPKLHTLRLPRSKWARLPQNYPSSITELQLGYGCSDDYDLTVARLSNLSAASFRTLHNPNECLRIMRLVVNITLTTLHLSYHAPWDDGCSLPATLTDLDIFIKPSFVALFHVLPRSLTNLTLVHRGSGQLPITSAHYKALPDLVKLFFRSAHKVRTEHFEALPRTLTICNALSFDIQGVHLAHLPKGMRHLSFPPRSRQCIVDGQHFALGPTSLTSIRFDTDTQSLNNLTLRYLPSTLLEFTHNRLHSIDGAGFVHFPRSLLELVLPTCRTVTNSSIAKLPPLLQTLVLGGDDQMLTSKSFKMLPCNLTSLNYLSMGSTDSASFADLPATITEIDLPGLGPITNEIFLHLPPLVQTLILRSNKSLTNKCLKLLRPSLKTLRLPANSNFTGLNHPVLQRRIQLWNSEEIEF